MEEYIMMKKDKNFKTEAEKRVDIILQDEEIKELIRELVIKTNQKGGNQTNLFNAIKRVWNETIEKEDEPEPYMLTDADEQFIQKIDAFMDKYGEALIKENHKDCNQSNMERFSNQYRITLILLYLVFEHEEKVTQNLLLKYAKDCFDIKPSYFPIQFYVREISCFFSLHLRYVENDGKIELMYDSHSFYGESLIWLEDFKKFRLQYRYSRRSCAETAIYVVWVLNKFF